MCESKRQPHGSAVCYVAQHSTRRCFVESFASAKIIAIGLFAMLVLVALLPTRHFVRVATCSGEARGVDITKLIRLGSSGDTENHSARTDHVLAVIPPLQPGQMCEHANQTHR